MKNAREAKEFLASQIATEAQRQNVALSEVELKMLYFSESGWTIPDMMAVSDEFDSTYDQTKYEKKIVRLIRGAYKGACKGDHSIYEKWWASIRVLNREDHYLSVMIRLAVRRRRHDQLKLFVTAIAVAAAFLAAMFVSIKYNIHLPSFVGRLRLQGSLGEYIWAGAVCAFVVYEVLRLAIGAKKTDDLVAKLVRQLARLSNRAG